MLWSMLFGMLVKMLAIYMGILLEMRMLSSKLSLNKDIQCRLTLSAVCLMLKG